MDSEQYAAELEAYNKRIENMDDAEYRRYMREDFEFDEGFDLYPEYQDYTDTWEYDFHYQACKYAKSFIIDDLATRNAKIKCGNHEHIFSLIPNTEFDQAVQTGQYIKLATETFINTEQCWFKTVLKAAHHLRDANRQGLVELTEPNFEFFTTIMATGAYVREEDEDDSNDKIHYISTKEQNKVYRAFERMWYHGSSLKEEHEISPTGILREAVGTAHLQKLIAGVINIKRKQQHDKGLFPDRITLLYGPTLLERHDFHMAFNLFGDDTGAIIKMMNSIRSKAKDHIPERDILNITSIRQAMATCSACKKPSPTVWTTPGIYYAPPGSGKTTAQEKGFITGFDTDWLTSGISEREVSFLLERRIPIITNQYTAFSGGKEKMIGFINPDTIRFRPGTKERFTEPEDVLKHAEKYYTQFFVITAEKKTYLLHRILEMRFAFYLAEYTKRRFLYKLRSGVKT